MFAVEKIQEELTGLVGVRQPLNPDMDRLDTDQYLSRSGLFLDDVEHFRIDYWIDGQSFAKATNEDLVTLWDQNQKSAISNVMARVFSRPDYIDRNLLFINTFDRNETTTMQEGKFYGYRIDLSDRKNVGFKITSLTLEGVYDDGELEIALFHSSQDEPIETISIELVGGTGELLKVPLNWTVNDSENVYKGSYFIGYRQLDDNFKPYKRNYQYAGNMSFLKELTISRVSTAGSLVNLENLNSESDHNGINLDITVFEDFTGLILNNAFLFAKAIQLQWAMSVMLQCVSSNRSNRNERMSKDVMNTLILAVEGQRGFGMQRVTGLKEQLTGELNRLNEEVDKMINGYFTGEITMDTVC